MIVKSILVKFSSLDYVAKKYKGSYSILQVGTGDSPLTIPFYEKCGFVRSHIVPISYNFQSRLPGDFFFCPLCYTHLNK